MNNNHSYRLTETGIRIPKHKTKWMKPPKDSKRKDRDRDIVISAPKDFSNLYAINLNAFLRNSDSSELDDIIAVEDLEGGRTN